MDRSPAFEARSAGLVAVGAAAGALGRWQIAEWIGTEPGRLPWETLLVNLTGCLLIGLAASRIEPGSDRWLFGVTGLLGGFTTFSAFSNETRALLDTDRVGTAVAYVAVTLAGGLLAVAAGRRVGA